ncbi:MAG: DNA/RNA nuclease SfsA [Desulfovibrionaceae bacterium]
MTGYPPLLPFPHGCVEARFLRRHKRFTVLCEREGRELAAHTNNTGSMLGLLRPGSRVLLSPAANPARKLAWTWELASFGGMWVGINTQTPNRMLRRAFEAGLLPGCEGYDRYEPERRAGQSRLDARISGPEGALWVECKNVTLVEDEVALFPDAVTERGQKHLRELMALARGGERVALFLLVQRADARCFAPAEVVDPAYATLLAEALGAGVEVWSFEADVSPLGIGLGRRLPLSGEWLARVRH